MNVSSTSSHEDRERRFGSWESAVQWLRSQPDRADLVRNAYYDDPLIEAAVRYWQSDEWESIRRFLPSSRPAAALDVGAGRGIASFALAKDGFSVTALEPDGSALVGAEAIRELAERTGLSIEVRRDFSERLPFTDHAFDLVFCRAVLHHTTDLRVACQEFFRVLKPGGLLIAVREHVISRPEDLPRFLASHPLHYLYGGENAFLLDDYLTALSSSGLLLKHVIAPFESAMNFAPYTLSSVQAELAMRLALGMKPIGRVVRPMLSLPAVWRLLLPLLERLDNRPGRHYSFVARRP